MSRLSTIELFKENLKFSAGHFTIFSSTSRENLHGHNYQLYVAFTTCVNEDGLAFDYRLYKTKLRDLCERIDETVIIPGLCKHLKVSQEGKHHRIIFNDEEMLFLNRDVTILPITNATVEELSHWFIQELTHDVIELASNAIVGIQVKVFSGPGQSGSATWQANNTKAPVTTMFLEEVNE